MNPISQLRKLMQSKPYLYDIRKDAKHMDKTNWKTSAIGIITCLIALAEIWAPAEFQGKISATAAALAGVGLIAAKDHNK